ncbi:sensor domain-containing diguanylate cyclase [Paenibacillus psychroresistens]|nr:diguanylate cyclase [Paenibacillus psychroresistens]
MQEERELWTKAEKDELANLRQRITEIADNGVALLESEERYRRLIELCPDGVLVHAEGKILFINQSVCEIFGYNTEDEVVGRNLLDFVHPDSKESLIETIQKASLDAEDTIRYDGEFIRSDGEYIHVETSGCNITYHGAPARLNILREVTERKIAEQKLKEANRILRHLSTRDGLTGIGNRRYFDEMFVKDWAQCSRYSKPLSLVMMDIDYFKAYNDTYGHLGGDYCLKNVAQALTEVLKRPSDSLARYGGEEFVVILPDVHEEGALIVAERIRLAIEGLQIPHIQSKVSEFVTISLGVATISPNKSMDSQDLIHSADKALYTSKKAGKNRISVYS